MNSPHGDIPLTLFQSPWGKLIAFSDSGDPLHSPMGTFRFRYIKANGGDPLHSPMGTFHCRNIKANGGDPLHLSLNKLHRVAKYGGHWFPPWASQSPHRLIWGPPWGQSPPSFRYWGPHWVPHGGPNGGLFPLWGPTFFLTLF